MRLRIWSLSLPLVTIAVMLYPGSVGQAVNPPSQAPDGIAVTRQLAQVPTAFTKNEGQWDERVLYRTTAGGATIWFTREGITYQFIRRIPRGRSDPSDLMERHGLPLPSGGEGRLEGLPGEEHDSIEQAVVHARFSAANPDVTIEATGLLGFKCNYFIGDDSAKWHTAVPSYSTIVYRNVRPGVDFQLTSLPGGLETQWIHRGDGGRRQVSFVYDGNAKVTETSDSGLVVEATWGVVLRSHESEETMRTGDERNRADAGSGSVTLMYSTFIGGGEDEIGFGIAVDRDGAAIVTGLTYSTDFPTLDSYDDLYSDRDVFISKLEPSGGALVYSTFLGGAGVEESRGIAVDREGAVYITGATNSSDFPVSNALDDSYNGGVDVFITKLAPSGGALEYSTFLGGLGNDGGEGIAVDESGAVYVTGWTGYTDFPIMNAYDGSHNGGNDAFVAKLALSGSALEYSTFLGGGDYDAGRGIAVDGNGAVCVTGMTLSSDFPTLNAHSARYGMMDVFVTKLAPAGSTLEYSTYLGGSSDDYGYAIAVDGNGAAYVTGLTLSPNFPTLNAYDGSHNGGPYGYDIFVTKLGPRGFLLEYSTYLGGGGDERGFAIAVDGYRAAHVTGVTTSSDFPTLNAYASNHSGGIYDAFVTRLAPSGSALEYSTYFGGGRGEEGHGIAVDGNGAVYMTGGTLSSDFPILNAFDGSHNGEVDAFVAKFEMPTCLCPHQADFDSQGTIDVIDLEHGIATVFFGAPEILDSACPTTRADFNNDGVANAVDLALLIDHVYFDGVGPVDPCLQ